MDKPNPPRELTISNTMTVLIAEMERIAPNASQIDRMPKHRRERRKYYQYYLELKEMLKDSVKEASDPDLALLLRASIALVAIRLEWLQNQTASQRLMRQ